jgi:hypothetical protein
MKKIMIIVPFTFLAFFVTAQSSRVEGAKKLTVAEANALNGVAQPTINGKPYSQHKAEQEALKKQKAVQSSYIVRADENNNGSTVTSAATTRTTEETTRVKSAPVSHQYVPSEQNAAYTEPPKEKVVEKAMVTAKAEAAKPTPATELPGAMIGTEKPVPTKEVASRKVTSQDADAKPLPTGVKQKGTEGGSATAVEAAVVKAPVKDAVVPQGKAPVAPTAIEEKSSEAGNSTSGERPAQVPPVKQH